jgi:hypothetical protein
VRSPPFSTYLVRIDHALGRILWNQQPFPPNRYGYRAVSIRSLGMERHPHPFADFHYRPCPVRHHVTPIHPPIIRRPVSFSGCSWLLKNKSGRMLDRPPYYCQSYGALGHNSSSNNRPKVHRCVLLLTLDRFAKQ